MSKSVKKEDCLGGSKKIDDEGNAFCVSLSVIAVRI